MAKKPAAKGAKKKAADDSVTSSTHQSKSTIDKIVKTIVKVTNAKYLTTKEMIVQAVSEIKDRKGASVVAIKKHIEEKLHGHITDQRLKQVTKLLRVADEEKWLLQVSGSGASSGSRFKLPDDLKKVMNKEMKEKEKKNKVSAKLKVVIKRKC